MSLSAISSGAVSNTQPEVTPQKTAPAAATHTAAASYPTDTVSLSHTASKPASAGDVDHDGDSH